MCSLYRTEVKLGENWLGQSEKQEIITKDVTPQPIQINLKVNEKPSQIKT